MDLVKEAFQKIKEEINLLKQEIALIKNQLAIQNPTNVLKSPTKMSYSTDTPAHSNPPTSYGTSSKAQNTQFSTGNEGVPTDTSTYTPTHQQTVNFLSTSHSFQPHQLSQTEGFMEAKRPLASGYNPLLKQEEIANQLDLAKVQEALDSLDNLKKEIRLKFKRLTPQEMTVFSTLYTLENQGFEEITYKIIANHLNLSESSIRDYSNKLLAKGIPIIKNKLNNKKIYLKISPELQKIASLSTINRLREL